MSELQRDITEVRKVQEHGGSLTITIPKISADDLGIERGDHLIITGKQGSPTLRAGKPDDLLISDD